MSHYKIAQAGTLPDVKLTLEQQGIDIPVHVANRFRIVRHEYISLLNQLLHEQGLGEFIDHGEPAGTIEHLL